MAWHIQIFILLGSNPPNCSQGITEKEKERKERRKGGREEERKEGRKKKRKEGGRKEGKKDGLIEQSY